MPHSNYPLPAQIAQNSAVQKLKHVGRHMLHNRHAAIAIATAMNLLNIANLMLCQKGCDRRGHQDAPGQPNPPGRVVKGFAGIPDSFPTSGNTWFRVKQTLLTFQGSLGSTSQRRPFFLPPPCLLRRFLLCAAALERALVG